MNEAIKINKTTMINKITIELMTTAGCHLCDEATQMFDYLLGMDSKFSNRFQLQLIEISNDDQLVADYGIRIPVLKSGRNELGWIFNLEQLASWLDEL